MTRPAVAESPAATAPVMDVAGRKIGLRYPTYFIADIAANHDGSLTKAKELVHLAKEAGADAAKFQHFRAEKIVSDHGFRTMGSQMSHQAKWKKSVVEVYAAASVPWSWTEELKATADKAGITFFSAPYDLEAIDMLDAWMPAYKIGSGDVNWLEAVERMAAKRKPMFVATGASTMAEVERTMKLIEKYTPEICVMQCNTNYTGSLENLKHIHLNVLKSYARAFPRAVLGLSDHTPGHATVLGAVALGARAVEKHFTDNRANEGPDHPFSMDPKDWREMVDRTRELEAALGSEIKTVAANETETVIIQRRCCRAARDLSAGARITREDIDVLRPAKPGAFGPDRVQDLVGRVLKVQIPKGEALSEEMLRS